MSASRAKGFRCSRVLVGSGLSAHVLQQEKEEPCVPCVLLCVAEFLGSYATLMTSKALKNGNRDSFGKTAQAVVSNTSETHMSSAIAECLMFSILPVIPHSR